MWGLFFDPYLRALVVQGGDQGRRNGSAIGVGTPERVATSCDQRAPQRRLQLRLLALLATIAAQPRANKRQPSSDSNWLRRFCSLLPDSR